MADTLELLTRRATLAPATADPEARTVEVVWSTGAPVRRRDMAGPYIERLSLDPQAVDLSRLEGASVLDAHRQTAVRDVLGYEMVGPGEGWQACRTSGAGRMSEPDEIVTAATRIRQANPI